MALPRLTPNKPSANAIPNLPKGEHEGRLVYVADLGLQEGGIFKGEQKDDAQQFSLGIEIIGETVELEIDGEKVTKPRILFNKPFNVFNKFTKKGKELELYKIFEPSATEKSTSDWEAQLGKPCNVSVIHVEKDGNTYDNISDLSPIPSKYHDGIGAAATEPCLGNSLESDNPVNKALYGLPKFVFDKRLSTPSDAPIAADEPPEAEGTEEDPFS